MFNMPPLPEIDHQNQLMFDHTGLEVQDAHSRSTDFLKEATLPFEDSEEDQNYFVNNKKDQNPQVTVLRFTDHADSFLLTK